MPGHGGPRENSGGARPGAGRKRDPLGRRNRVTVWLDDARYQALARRADEAACDPPTYARQVLERDLDR